MCNAAKQVILDSDLPTAKKFLAYRVAELVNDSHDHDFWMNPTVLAEEIDLDPGTVRKYLRSMVDAGFMVVTEQGGGRWKTTRYKFIGCAAMHKPRSQARKADTAPVVPDTAPPMHETAPLIRDTAPGGAAYKENNKEPEITTTESPKSESDQAPPPTSHAVLDEITAFEAWWERWPRKERRKAAAEAYAIQRRNGATAADLEGGLTRYLESRTFADGYVYGATNWLNRELWRDEPQPANEPSAGPGPLQPPAYEPDTDQADPAASADAIRRIRQETAA